MLLTHDPKSEILKKVWKNFPRNPLSDHPIFGNIFQDLAIWINGDINVSDEIGDQMYKYQF